MKERKKPIQNRQKGENNKQSKSITPKNEKQNTEKSLYLRNFLNILSAQKKN